MIFFSFFFRFILLWVHWTPWFWDLLFSWNFETVWPLLNNMFLVLSLFFFWSSLSPFVCQDPNYMYGRLLDIILTASALLIILWVLKNYLFLSLDNYIVCFQVPWSFFLAVPNLLNPFSEFVISYFEYLRNRNFLDL